MASNHTPTPAPTEPKPATIRVPGRSRLAVVGLAAAAAVAGWAVLGPVAGITLEAQQGGIMRIGVAAVFVVSAVAALAGWGLLTILERNTVKARDIWTVIATIVCVTSLSSPIDRGVGLGAKLGLVSLHLIVGTVVIIGLRRTAMSARDRC